MLFNLCKMDRQLSAISFFGLVSEPGEQHETSAPRAASQEEAIKAEAPFTPPFSVSKTSLS